MSRTIAITVLIAASLSQGCTLILPVGSAVSTHRHNEERKARIAAGMIDPATDEGPKSGGAEMLGGLLLGAALDVAVVLAIDHAIGDFKITCYDGC